MKTLETFAYVFLIVAAATVTYKQFNQPGTDKPKVGQHLDLPVKWSKTNVVVAMSSQCHFCQESIPFYQQLSKLADDGKISFTVVSPESPAVFEKFVDSSNIHARVLSNTPFHKLSVSGTPTMLVLNDKGIIESVLVGKQAEEKEGIIIAKLNRR